MKNMNSFISMWMFCAGMLLTAAFIARRPLLAGVPWLICFIGWVISATMVIIGLIKQ